MSTTGQPFSSADPSMADSIAVPKSSIPGSSQIHPLASPLPAVPGLIPSPSPISNTGVEPVNTTSGDISNQTIGGNGAGHPKESSSAGEVGSITPPELRCHLKVLIISGQNHVFSFEPEITVGRMKEIVWSSWPNDWTTPSAPPSPTFLRVLYSGRILQDDSTLASNNLATALLPTNPTVIHISVRSFSLRGDEGDPKKPGFLHPTTSRNSRRNEEVASSGGCKCVIM